MSEELSEKKQEISKEHDIEVEPKSDEAANRDKLIAEIIQVQREFSGPIPHPDIIQGYENVVPGSADRIIKMAEVQAQHRQDMESIMVRAESRDGLLGVLFAFALGIGSLVASVVVVVMVPQSSGAISSAALGITGIGSIITAFLKTTRRGYNSTKSNPKKEDEE